jgi:hypothetical protein
MRITTAAFVLGTALTCSLWSFAGAAHAQDVKVVRQPRTRVVVRPAPPPTPYWDSYIVPRYRYRPEDDKVDPYGPPVVPVVRVYGGMWFDDWY